MAHSVLVQIADALVAAINAGDLGFRAVREWAAEWTLTDLATLRVVVIPTERLYERDSRVTWTRRFRYTVGVQKRHGGAAGDPGPLDKLDPLDALAESLAEFLVETAPRLQLSGFGANLWRITNPVPVSDEMLDRKRTFTSVLDVEYRKAP